MTRNNRPTVTTAAAIAEYKHVCGEATTQIRCQTFCSSKVN